MKNLARRDFLMGSVVLATVAVASPALAFADSRPPMIPGVTGHGIEAFTRLLNGDPELAEVLYVEVSQAEYTTVVTAVGLLLAATEDVTSIAAKKRLEAVTAVRTLDYLHQNEMIRYVPFDVGRPNACFVETQILVA